MDAKTLSLIDYNRLQDAISFYCVSEEARAVVRTRLPESNPSNIMQKKQFTRELMLGMHSRQGFSLKAWSNCSKILQILLVQDSTLTLSEVFSLSQLCISVQHFLSQFTTLQKEFAFTQLAILHDSLPDLQNPLKEILRILDPSTGELRDLPEIRAIKAEIVSIRQDIQRLIKKITTDSTLRDALQSDVPTISGERQVLAVKANFRGRIRGIVHEVSHTGQTLYIEPEAVVLRNNDLLQEESHLQIAIRRILHALTACLRGYHADFCTVHNKMVELDVAYSGARWGLEQNAVVIQDSLSALENPIKLLQARHPLLGIAAVPVDVVFLPGKNVLIITGANTGGKTVTLKTIALFAALNQTALPLPCAEESVLPFFDAIFADIGDDQSLDQSLSTFGAHMKHLAHMTEHATEHSLILLDELGSGTDPQEGGAIGMAVLDYFLKKQSTVIVSTHHGCLKNYGYIHDACINASAAFDTATLLPTYRIIMGVPGESHALDIALKSKLLPEIVEKARSYVITEQADISTLIAGLTKKYQEAMMRENDQFEKERLLTEKSQKLLEKDLQLREKEQSVQELLNRQSNTFLDESRRQLENLVRELREGEISKLKTKKVKTYIEETQKQLASEKDSLQKERDKLAEEQRKMRQKEQKKQKRSALEVYEQQKIHRMKSELSQYTEKSSKENKSSVILGLDCGLEVLVNSTGKRGVLLQKTKKSSWLVQLGQIKMTVPEKDLIVLAKSQKMPAVSIEVQTDFSTQNPATVVDTANTAEQLYMQAGIKNGNPAFELRLLGMRLDEALKTLEKQIDLAHIKGITKFAVIHGKGSGVLQEGVQKYLKERSEVGTFFFAPPEAGGSGKTFVELQFEVS